MNYNFDAEISRIGTANVKWDARKSVFGREDIIPMSIADMDFAVMNEVTEALQSRIEHPIYGYNVNRPSLFDSVAAWCQRRHAWNVNSAHLMVVPGVVPGIIMSIMALTEPTGNVLIQTPVYPPFFAAINDTGRTVVENELVNVNGYYTIDFEDFAQKAADPRTTLFVLCSPHNPVGRVWTKEELEQIHNICAANGVTVISDEIHHDIVYAPHRHTMYGLISDEAARQSITLLSASKTFNLAGLNTAFAIIPDSKLRAKLKGIVDMLHLGRPNIFGAIAAEAAYTHGDEWLDQLLVYLKGNAEYINDFVRSELPEVKTTTPEGTYLTWLDFRYYFNEDEELKKFLFDEAKVGLNLGLPYGATGNGFARINFGAPRRTIVEAMERIAEKLKTL